MVSSAAADKRLTLEQPLKMAGTPNGPVQVSFPGLRNAFLDDPRPIIGETPPKIDAYSPFLSLEDVIHDGRLAVGVERPTEVLIKASKVDDFKHLGAQVLQKGLRIGAAELPT